MVALRLLLDGDPSTPATARDEAAALVRATWPGEDDLVGDVRQVTGELVANAVRHGAAPVSLEVGLVVVGDRPRVTVVCRDSGSWRGPGTGRGLALVRTLCDRVDVATADGTTVVTAVLGRRRSR